MKSGNLTTQELIDELVGRELNANHKDELLSSLEAILEKDVPDESEVISEASNSNLIEGLVCEHLDSWERSQLAELLNETSETLSDDDEWLLQSAKDMNLTQKDYNYFMNMSIVERAEFNNMRNYFLESRGY